MPLRTCCVYASVVITVITRWQPRKFLYASSDSESFVCKILMPKWISEIWVISRQNHNIASNNHANLINYLVGPTKHIWLSFVEHNEIFRWMLVTKQFGQNNSMEVYMNQNYLVIHSSKYLFLCSTEERKSSRFGTTKVNDDRIFIYLIFRWTKNNTYIHTYSALHN